jgi:2-polyprenyl-3-methyl-5-hydroxy-6-metoxy-1,4-benzoquinol methylase
MMSAYSRSFFARIKDGSTQSAREIVPIIMSVVQPRSVVDVGCGVGSWLSVFKDQGVKDILGIDGQYVDRRLLQIPEQDYLGRDLRTAITLDRQYDLVVSLEVAEHLPEECATTFIESLVRMGPVVLFSAAIPRQGGTSHVNEQWPEYWNRLFKQRDYLVIDCIRKRVWHNQNAKVWYRQNILLYVEKSYLAANKYLSGARKETDEGQLAVVHPELFAYYRLSARQRMYGRARDLVGSVLSRCW